MERIKCVTRLTKQQQADGKMNGKCQQAILWIAEQKRRRQCEWSHGPAVRRKTFGSGPQFSIPVFSREMEGLSYRLSAFSSSVNTGHRNEGWVATCSHTRPGNWLYWQNNRPRARVYPPAVQTASKAARGLNNILTNFSRDKIKHSTELEK